MLPQADVTTWNRAAAAHLLNRAGFGGTPQEIDATLKLGRAQAIAALLTVPAPVPGPTLTAPQKISELRVGLRSKTPAERQEIQKQIQKLGQEELAQIREWWLTQMTTPRTAALEKAVLFWHGHFATSIQKVKNADLMWQQNQLFRKFALGNFRDLTKAISCDPAMVIWLDLQQSRSGAPNENFARELMELFTLGIGRYSEDDIKASARAFTGYRSRPFVGGFTYIEQQHDATEKTFMGKTGPYSGDDIIDIICEQRACAEFICAKLWTFYAYEDPEPALISPLAHIFRQANYEIRPVLAEIFGSKAFNSEKALATQIKSPTQLIAQTCHLLQCPIPRPPTLQYTMRSLGQVLFAPPNVKGWDGNRAWINTATLASRAEFTDSLLGIGENARLRQVTVPLEKLVTDPMLNDPALLIDGLTHRLLATTLDPATRQELIADATKYPKPYTRTAVRETLSKIMRLPEYQLV